MYSIVGEFRRVTNCVDRSSASRPSVVGDVNMCVQRVWCQEICSDVGDRCTSSTKSHLCSTSQCFDFGKTIVDNTMRTNVPFNGSLRTAAFSSMREKHVVRPWCQPTHAHRDAAPKSSLSGKTPVFFGTAKEKLLGPSQVCSCIAHKGTSYLMCTGLLSHK